MIVAEEVHVDKAGHHAEVLAFQWRAACIMEHFKLPADSSDRIHQEE